MRLDFKRRAARKTKESLELFALRWLSWFNRCRLLVPVRNIDLAKPKENFYRQLASQAVMSDGHKTIGLHETQGRSPTPKF